MDLKITPNKLSGTVSVPSSKSMTHRAIICAALAKGKSVLTGISFSDDIYASINALKALGAEFEIKDDTVTVYGIQSISDTALIDCIESGSTLRFLVPVAAALGADTTFIGKGRLPQRPITPYLRELSEHGITFDYNNTMPFSLNGTLIGGVYKLEGDISSQFITGLLFALPLLSEDSEIVMLSPLESKPYADMTIGCLQQFGIKITETDNGYSIKGGQKYTPCDMKIEGDYSQAAFFFVANAIGNSINIQNLGNKSLQGDKKIIEIIELFNDIGYNNNYKKNLYGFCVNASNIPDLVPILAVLGCFGCEKSVITGAKRLKIKESDRLIAISTALNAIGGKVTPNDDGLTIEPIKEFNGGIADSFNDHRIAMSLAVAASRSISDVTITHADAVKKSYPNFFDEYQHLGGKINVINVE